MREVDRNPLKLCSLYMGQINLNVTPEFEADLEALMKARSLKTKSEAIRLAVHEAAALHASGKKWDLSPLIGFIDRLPRGPETTKTAAELEAEIDDEMEDALNRLPGEKR